MDFLIKCSDKLEKFSDLHISIDHWDDYIEKEYKSQNRIFILGDVVFPAGRTHDDVIDLFDETEIFEVIKDLGGHFYLFFWRESTSTLEIYTSYGSILPVYYSDEKEMIVSSSVKKILGAIGSSIQISKEFIIERLLFNYPITDITLMENIKRLNNNHCLLVCKKMESYQYFDNIDLLNFDKSLSLKEIIEIFINTAYRYSPTEKYYLSFTGGFDGRTLLSVLYKKYKNLITTYSFGRLESSDVKIPQSQAEKMGLNYYPFDLNNPEYIDNSISFGEEFITASSGEANFTRSHYLWACYKIKKEAKYILSGNFGSEVLRSPHITGILFSNIVFKIISGESKRKIIDYIYSTDLKLILPENGKTLLKNILERINELNWAKYKTDDLNKKCYYFMLDEMLRRYFGPEIKSQANHLYNRTPYYDFKFISELFKSNYSGLNNKFFEQNKIKRFKGQLLYAYIIKNTNNDLLNMMTGKGYRPVDLLTYKGKLKIIYSKLLARKKEVEDPYVTKYLLEKNFNSYRQNLSLISDFGFRVEKLEHLNITHKSTLFSIAKYLKVMGKLDG
ncbi:MAG: hypothetical protein JW866_10065 [Ignavibacteriales bacterium]|nr:hypothetical protein [Ignavibacteriales bacterium]